MTGMQCQRMLRIMSSGSNGLEHRVLLVLLLGKRRANLFNRLIKEVQFQLIHALAFINMLISRHEGQFPIHDGPGVLTHCQRANPCHLHS